MATASSAGLGLTAALHSCSSPSLCETVRPDGRHYEGEYIHDIKVSWLHVCRTALPHTSRSMAMGSSNGLMAESPAHGQSKALSLGEQSNEEQRYDGQWRNGKQHGIGWQHTERISEALFVHRFALREVLRAEAGEAQWRMDGRKTNKVRPVLSK